MHQKKIPRVKNILHSIPISRKKVYSKKNSSSLSSFLNNRSIVIKNKHLRYVSSSIPLACSVALLLLSICIVSPNSNPFISHANVYAEEDTSSSSGEAVGGTEILNPTAELTVEGDLTQTTLAGLGSGPVYRSHNVSINVNDVTDYTLRVSYANGSNNALEYYGTSGDTVTTGGTTIGGVGNAVKSNSMPENSWGFGWSDNKDAGDNELDYYTMPNYGSNNTGLAGGVLANKSNNEGISNTAEGKLVFAANFKNDAVAGHYKTSVLLSLAATPKKVTTTGFGGITNMQDMTASICNAAKVGDSNTLVDVRDNSEYSVMKLEDGRCWMTQNLRITGDSIKAKDPSNTTGTITSADSNVSSNYNIPASSSPWSDTSATTNKVHYAGNTTNGAYYTWYTATASTQGSNYSICPRGWKLPSIEQYRTFLKAATINFQDCNGMSCSGSSSANDSIKIRGAPYNFPYAGYVYNGSLQDVGSWGSYWSSTANGTDYAYRLYFNSSEVDTGNNIRYLGFSVRCIVDNQPKDENEAIEMTEGFGGIKKMQDMTSDICNQSTIPNGTTGQLYDSRDLNIYDVAKLDDGRCWMTQNLKLDISKANSLSGKDTNLASETSTWPSKDLTASGFSNSNTEPVWNNGTGVTVNSNSGAYDASHGYYYNWCAATAGSCSSATTNNAIASSSICPRGWKLPTKAQYDTFLSTAGIGNDKAGSTKIRGTPYNFPYAGFVASGSLLYVGSGGYYWSSTANGADGAYYLGFDSSYVYFGLNYLYSRYNGFSVRCIVP